MDRDEIIRTQFDDLIANLKLAGGKPVSVWELSSKIGMPQKSILEWLTVLERSGQVDLESRLGGTYASWTGSFDVSTMENPSESERRAKEEIHASFGGKAAPSQGKKEKIPSGETPDEAKMRHQKELLAMNDDLVSVSEQISRVDDMLSKLKEKKRERQSELAREKEAHRQLDTGTEKAALEHSAPEPEEFRGEAPLPADESKPVPGHEENEQELIDQAEREIQAITGQPEEEQKEETTMLPEEPTQPIKPLLNAPASPYKTQKIRKPQPVQVTGVSLQFSEKLSKQVKKIISQAQEIEKLRMEKEKLLTEHYLPMQRRLDSEIETISDRVIRMEKNIMALHQRASDIPSKVQNVEKLHNSSLRAHGQLQKGYDEAAALIEESTRELSEERQKMETLVEESRQEIASHRAKAEELEKTLRQISQLEEESSNLVISARAALAEQAERLSTAEKYSQELGQLKGEIQGGVESIKREVSATKGVLTGIEKQMSQMRQIEIWADSIRDEYAQKMGEIGDYIRNGNEEFETLRESVEANFVRRYLKELRELTDSYSFEFNQAKSMETALDQRIAEEKKGMEELLSEGRKISYFYETQSKEVAGGDKFEGRAETFRSLSSLSGQRQQLEQMISRVTGEKAQLMEDVSPSSAGKKPSVRIFGSAPKAIKHAKHHKAAKKGKKAGRR